MLYWVGQKVCSGFSVSVLRENLNALFSQPNIYTRFSDLIHLVTESLYLSLASPYFPSPQLMAFTILLSVSMPRRGTLSRAQIELLSNTQK